MKSYHSSAFPITAAATWSGLGVERRDDAALMGVNTIMHARLIDWAMKASSNGKCSCTRAKVGIVKQDDVEEDGSRGNDAHAHQHLLGSCRSGVKRW